jgi:hypothetical protein
MAAPEPVADGDPCRIAPPPIAPPETLSIAVSTPTSQGDVAPADLAVHRFQQTLIYQNLIGVDCTGALVPELAERWAVDATGRDWTFTIQRNAQWPGGEPVTSRDVIAAWRSSPAYRSTLGALLEAAQAIDARRLRVTLADGDPRVLAARELTVQLREPATGRVNGTGSYGADGVARQARTPDSASMTELPRLVVLPMAPLRGADARDMLDRDVDVMFTSDPAGARYAAEQEGLAVYPLPPDRTYSIVTPRGVHNDSTVGSAVRAVRASLARDVVQVPARPASGPWWWTDATPCALVEAVGITESPAVSPRVAYRADDPVARAIAERLVSLASRANDTVANRLLGTTNGTAPDALGAEALDARDFAQALRDRTRTAFIIAVPIRPLARCGALADLAAAMPWAVSHGLIDSAFVTPLVDAGGWAVVRRGAVGISVDWEGTPRLVVVRSRSPGGAP